MKARTTPSIPPIPNIVYSHGFYGNFTRTDLSVPAGQRGRGGDAPAQPAPPQGPQRTTPIRPKGEGLRAQWMAPIILSPHDPKTVYVGFQYVFRSTNRGDEWEKISEDLTANDPAQMLPKSSNEIPYQTITALAESPRVKGLLYAGTDDGRLHVTADAGKTWTDLSSRVPSAKWYSRVVPSQHADQTRLHHAARPRRRRLRGVRLQVHRRRQDVHEHRSEPARPAR